MKTLPLLAALLLAGCALPPPAVPPRVDAAAQLPSQWLAPLPHGGSTQALQGWFAQFQDPALQRLLAQAQAASPSLQGAMARLDEARALARASAASLQPRLDAEASVQRSRLQLGLPATTVGSAQLQARWELDLFGANRAQAQAAGLQAQALQSQWHAARVSLAADVAAAYISLRHAQAQEEVAEFDALAASALADWGALQRRAGLISASDAALLNTQRAAALAQRADARALAQIALISLAQLCARPAAELAVELAPPALAALPQRRVPVAPQLAVDALPAQVLAQRPDLAAAHQQWLAAAYAEHGARMQERPQLSLGALLGRQQVRLSGADLRGTVWQVLPSISLPLFDGGALDAQTRAASARSAQAAAAFEERWRSAVAEVDDAVQRLLAANERRTQVDGAHLEWQRIANDAVRLSAAGIQSGPQRANTQRNALAAYSALLAVHHEQAQAWVRLYRTLGGGWQATDPAPTNTATQS